MITLLEHVEIAAAYLTAGVALFAILVGILYIVDLRWNIIDPFRSLRSQFRSRPSRLGPLGRTGR